MNAKLFDIDRLPPDVPLRIMIGAGEQSWPGWIATDQASLDLLRPDLWGSFFSARRADAFLCEHVWEHLSEAQGQTAAATCFSWLKPGGYLRCAVPDGNFPDPVYQQNARVGGPGAADHPAAGHKVLYDYRRLTALFTRAGFRVDLLEYCDERGRFHYNQWSSDDGPIYRSLLLDHRNRAGKMHNVSLIVDAHKPQNDKRA